MNEGDLRRRCEAACRAAGYTVRDSHYHPGHFGSWWFEVSREGLPRQQVIWDGKDHWLIVQAFASSGSWMDKWVGRKKSEQSAEAAVAALDVPVTREWEMEIERERAEYRRKFQLEQALDEAARLWAAGCYRDYVAELAPFREQLSPAQVKRLAIAEKRASG
ncbi:MAG: hypothetical protein QOE79_1597 [Sphingomonadales bacterium]|jgi:hypothetical protein|nr:hypothetical protein [Sphingomonadales bacterium]